MKGAAMRLLKAHRGKTAQVYLDGVSLEGVLMEVTGDAVSLAEVTATEPNGVADLPGPVVVATSAIVWAVVIP